jgi:integration host factor subunit alpha
MKRLFWHALTKADIVKALNQYKWLFKGDEAYNLVENLLEIIKRSLESGEGIMISGFGKFSVREKKKRMGRNPQTGEGMDLDLRRVVGFKCSGLLKDKINGNWDINRPRKR